LNCFDVGGRFCDRIVPTWEAARQKTNAARLLDQMGIRYELREYEVDPEDLVAEAVAAKIGPPPGQLFKTLVAEGDRHGILSFPKPDIFH